MIGDQALASLEAAYRARAAFAGGVGLACVAIAVVLMVIAVNSLRGSAVRLSTPEKRGKNYRTKRLLRAYVLFTAGVTLFVVGGIKLGSTDTWFAFFRPAAHACLEAAALAVLDACR